MLRFALFFLVFALITSFFGFSGVANAASELAQFVFFLCVVVGALVLLRAAINSNGSQNSRL
jgi:uncharacterized membrane protein YtjA (UPF0391 family)